VEKCLFLLNGEFRSFPDKEMLFHIFIRFAGDVTNLSHDSASLSLTLFCQHTDDVENKY
jgi:hypothetical protein